MAVTPFFRADSIDPMSINFTTLATGALAFTIALAWNDAVSKTIQSIFPPTNKWAAARATLLYALIITILVIFIVAVINHTRKVIHKFTGGASSGREVSGFQSGGPLPPIIRLWEPPHSGERPALALPKGWSKTQG